jgi:hypothetical protein
VLTHTANKYFHQNLNSSESDFNVHAFLSFPCYLLLWSFIQCALGIHSGCTNGVQGWVCSEQRPSATWAGSMEFNFAALTGICGIMVFIHGLSPMTCLLVVPGDIWSACQVLNSLPPKAMCSYPYFYESYHHPPSQLELCFSFSLFQL